MPIDIGSFYNAGESVIGTKKASLAWPSPAEAIKLDSLVKFLRAMDPMLRFFAYPGGRSHHPTTDHRKKMLLLLTQLYYYLLFIISLREQAFRAATFAGMMASIRAANFPAHFFLEILSFLL